MSAKRSARKAPATEPGEELERVAVENELARIRALLEVEIISPEEALARFRTFVAEEQKIDSHNRDEYEQLLKKYAAARGIDVRSDGGLEVARRALQRDGAKKTKERASSKKGGHMGKGRLKKGGPSGEVLRSEVAALMRGGAGLTEAREQVAKTHGLGLNTVKNRIDHRMK